MPTVVLVLAAIAVTFGVIKKHHHGWVAFAAIVLGIALMHSPLSGPTDEVVNAFAHAGEGLLRLIGLHANA